MDGGRARTGLRISSALRPALVAAAVAAALCFPVVAYLALPGTGGNLALESRWMLVAKLAFAVFALTLLVAGAGWLNRTQAATDARASRDGALASLAKYVPKGGLAALLLYPVIIVALVGWSGAIKWVDNFGVQILIYVMLGWGLSIVVGLAGLLDLGFIAFAAVGAYAYTLIALHVLPALAPGLVPYAFWVCLPISALLAALWGILLGFPVLRLRGDYLAIVTLAFGEMIRLVLVNWTELTNGYAGIKAPRITFFGIPFTTPGSEPTFAETFGLSQSPTIYRAIFLYYVILGLALLTAWVSNRLRQLPIGRAWEALREDEIACRALGLNTVTTKLSAFAIGAAFGGMAGAFLAARQGFLNPSSFEFMQSATVLAIVVLGGMGSLTGVAVAAVVMIGGTELLREITWLKSIFGPQFDPTQYRMLLFGLAMVAMMIWRPRGLVSTRDPSIFLKVRKAVSSDLVKEGHG
ncbi:MAG: high-affinity branched-chain amino acid ABC transporter permease LivM [Hyphomicrobiaceae bacterium]